MQIKVLAKIAFFRDKDFLDQNPKRNFMFGYRINLFSLAGFRIGIDISWFFIAILLSWTLAVGYFPFYYPHLSPQNYWLMGLLGMLGLFISVILHELGHAVIARKFNLNISQITLFIFGGVAELKDEPPSPKAEFYVAIAGPIVSVILALITGFLAHTGEQLGWPVMFTGVMSYLAMINTVVVIFNLIPAFPLDGGRVFRALLWWWKDNLEWATRIASHMGAGFGLFLIFMGILSFMSGSFFAGAWWVILGLFLQQAASSSRTQYYIRHELEGAKVSKFMTKNPISVSPDISIKDFVDAYVYQSHHHLYPITQGDQLVGYVSIKEVKHIPSDEWKNTAINKIMVPTSAIQTVTPETNALKALTLIQENNVGSLLVVEDENKHLVGILTAQDLFKLIALKLELE